jgi:hypothetical protein
MGRETLSGTSQNISGNRLRDRRSFWFGHSSMDKKLPVLHISFPLGCSFYWTLMALPGIRPLTGMATLVDITIGNYIMDHWEIPLGCLLIR